jgi:hypothetical protein
MVSAFSLNGHAPATAMPPFRFPDATIRITFPETSPWHGAIILCDRFVSVDRALELDQALAEHRRHAMEQAKAALAGEAPDQALGMTLALYESIHNFGATTLVAWNLTGPRLDPDEPQTTDADGFPAPNYLLDANGARIIEPLPPTAEALMSLPFEFAQDLLAEYHRRKVDLSSPLAMRSSDTPSPLPSTPPAANNSRSTRKRGDRSKRPTNLPEPS